MEFKKISKGALANAKRYGKDYKVKIDLNFLILKLFEETGEFAQAALIGQKKSRPEKFVTAAKSRQHSGKELADVVGIAMCLAETYGIDLEKSLRIMNVKSISFKASDNGLYEHQITLETYWLK